MTPSFYVVSLLYSLGFNQKVNMKKVGYKLLQFLYPGSSVYLTIKMAWAYSRKSAVICLCLNKLR